MVTDITLTQQTVESIANDQREFLKQLQTNPGRKDAADRPLGVLKAYQSGKHRAITKYAPEFRPDGGYGELGEFLADVAHIAKTREVPESFQQYQNSHLEVAKKLPRKIAKASGMAEGIISDGGALVPTEFLNQLLYNIWDNNVMNGLRMVPIQGNTINIPTVNETSRVDGSRSGGARFYMVGEGGTFTASKPSLKKVNLTLNKAACLSYVTDELLEDSPTAIEQFITPIMISELQFGMGSQIIRGDGVDKPVGMINAANGSLVTQTKESGQAATTLVPNNLLKMYSRIPAPMQSRMIWYYNQSITPQLSAMSYGTTNAWPVYLPAGGLSATPYSTILGRPAYPIEFCSTLGTLGDVIACVPDQYLFAQKGGIAAATSLHVQFLTDEMAYRWTVRYDGKPWWLSAVTPYQGTVTLSPFVITETR